MYCILYNVRLPLCRVFDRLSFDCLSFDRLSFDRLSFDQMSFDPMSVNHMVSFSGKLYIPLPFHEHVRKKQGF